MYVNGKYRYDVHSCRHGGGPRHYGYTLRITPPHVTTHEDVEGVGYVAVGARVTRYVGWYKFRRDAEHSARVYNEANAGMAG